MQRNLTEGPITKTILLFSLPMIAGNLLQQLYNVADTLIVGRFLGAGALAAVGSSYTLMTFLTSILLGLCMGSGAVFSIRYGEGSQTKLKESMGASFLLIFCTALVLNLVVFLFIDPILSLLQVPEEIYGMMRDYLWVIFWGIMATFFYNYFASLLRAVGNSLLPLVFLAVCAILNIVLDLWFVLGLSWGGKGSCLCHGDFPVCFRHRAGGLYLYSSAGFPPWKEVFKTKVFYDKRNCPVFFPYLSAAVCDESGNSHGSGIGKQLWNGDYGSFCSSGKDRLFCLYASAGFRKCFFYFCCSEFWGQEGRKDTERNEAGGGNGRCFLSGHFPSGLCLCQTLDDDIRGGPGDGNPESRRGIPENRGRFLLWNRLSLSPVWIL